ncbi:hypothetical protein DENSPDRAFT_886684 [Dentipellis sp. KUC8613]|nr:hypothetical protein DENSPDRAFT_886684 [Dentipellis sp. KUC8613]
MKTPRFRAHRYSLHPYTISREGQHDRTPLHRQSYPFARNEPAHGSSGSIAERSFKPAAPIAMNVATNTGPSASSSSAVSAERRSETLLDIAGPGSQAPPQAGLSISSISEVQIPEVREAIHIDFRALGAERTLRNSTRASVTVEDTCRPRAEDSGSRAQSSVIGDDSDGFEGDNGSQFVPSSPSSSLLSLSSTLSTIGPSPGLHGPSSTPQENRPELVEKKIRGVDGLLRWFGSVGGQRLASPPSLKALELGDLFIHRADGATQVWMWTKAEEWVEAREGQAHPTLLKHRLRVTPDGTPSWVLRKTITNYRGKEKRDKGKHH